MSWRYFKRAEFACRHCGENLILDSFVERLDELRHICGFPLIVTSGYRCPAHNNKVSSTGLNGPHTTGEAVDLLVDRKLAFTVVKHAIPLGFTGLGFQQKGHIRFLHLDTLEDVPGQPRPTVWSY